VSIRLDQPLHPGSRRDEDGPAPGGGGVPHRNLILMAAAVVVVAALLAWLVAFSSVFGAKTIEVRGEHSLIAEQVSAAAAISQGAPLIRLDTGAIAARVEALPDIASARVQTKYPSTVIITVTERIAIGYLQTGGRYALVDKTGDQFRTQPSKPAQLPLFEIPAGAQAKASAAAEATVAAALPRSVLVKVASIQAFDPTAITLLMTDQRVVRWGSADQSDLKAKILPALLTQPGATYDLTNPQMPFTH
jgi:cell division protein FtsQ